MIFCPEIANAVQEPADQEFVSSAWLWGPSNMEPVVLALRDDRLTLADSDGNILFQAEKSAFDEFAFPWNYWGDGLRIRVCGDTYSLFFSPPGGGQLTFRLQGISAPELTRGDSPSPRDLCAAWRQLLS